MVQNSLCDLWKSVIVTHGCIYILLDTVLATDVIYKYSLTTTRCRQRWRTDWIHLGLFLGVEQRTVGCLVTSKHNKAAVRDVVSQRITGIHGTCRPSLLAAVGGYTYGNQWW